MQLSRRDFLRLSGAGLGSALASGVSVPQQGSRTLLSRASALGILYDPSKCVGCRACQMACKAWNKLPDETTDDQKIYETPLSLSADTWTLIKLRSNQADWSFFSYQCMHCTDAACVTVCPSGALYKDERGFTAYDREKCIGCGYCTQFCPYGVPHLHTTNLLTGEAKMGKCTFCQDRVWSGVGGPSCAEACPVGALVWGPWETLRDQAQQRVTTLHEQGLSDARLYGESETGGLHRLSILLGEPGQYNLPVAPLEPTVAHFWQTIVQPLGNLAFGGVIVGLIGAFLISRRSIRMEEVR